MKRISLLSLILVLAICLPILTACDNGSSNGKTTASQETTAREETTTDLKETTDPSDLTTVQDHTTEITEWTSVVCGETTENTVEETVDMSEIATEAPETTEPPETTIKTEETVDELGHDYGSVVTAPTATEDGSIVYTCSVCDYSYNETIIPIDFTVTAENRAKNGYTGETDEHLIIPIAFCDNTISTRLVNKAL